MGKCDLCSAPLGEGSKCYTQKQMQEFTLKGLKPPDAMLDRATLFGVNKEQMKAGWVNILARDRGDWVLCQSCTSNVEKRYGIPFPHNPIWFFVFAIVGGLFVYFVQAAMARAGEKLPDYLGLLGAVSWLVGLASIVFFVEGIRFYRDRIRDRKARERAMTYI